MTLRFDQPLWFLLLLLAAPVAWAGARWMVAMSPARRWSAVAARVALLALAAAMLAGASAVRSSDAVAVVALVDVSGSVERFADLGRDGGGARVRPSEAARAFLKRASRGRRPDDRLGLVAFDGGAVAVAAPSGAEVLDRPLDFRTAEGTDIAGAVRLAWAMMPPGAHRRVVLISDGNETAGNAARAAAEAGGPGREARAPIDVVPISYRLTREVVVESVDAPPRAVAGGSVAVRVTLFSTGESTGTLRLLREGAEVAGAGRRLTLVAGRTVVSLEAPLGEGRVHRFEAVFEPDAGADGTFSGDTVPANNRGEAFTLTPGRGEVLLVDGVGGGDPAGKGALLGRALEGTGLRVRIVPPEGLPTEPLALQAYDLVILENVGADAAPHAAHALLASYVSDLGGGLVMVGGPDSFGAGGWKGTALEPVLPVGLDLPERAVAPGAAIVFVLDNSGSMGASVLGTARTQQQIANEGAALAVESIDKNDLVGVIAFNSSPSTVVPLARNAGAKAAAGRVRGIAPGGGTNLPPALSAARRALAGVDAPIKHVIVLSDGRSLHEEEVPEIARAMGAEGVTVSTIAVGDEADTGMMTELARLGGGAYYRVTDPSILPRIFMKAVKVLRTPLIREEAFTPVVPATGSEVTSGTAEPPPLGGLVLTRAREGPGSAGVTYAMLTPGGEPVLAHWSAGLGRVVAFTSDAHRWGAAWLDWPGYAPLWGRIARYAARTGSDRGSELTTEIVGDELRIRLDVSDDRGAPVDLLDVPAKVYGPAGAGVDGPVGVALVQTGPGRYEGRAGAAATGNYVVMATPRGPAGSGGGAGRRGLSPVLGAASRATGAEYRALASNGGLLRRLAEGTGGRGFRLDDPEPASLFDREGLAPVESRSALWPVLLPVALGVLLLDVATRRVAWDRLLSRRFGADVAGDAAAPTRDRGAVAAAASGRLRGRGGLMSVGAEGATLSGADAKRIIASEAARRRAARRGGGAGEAGEARAPKRGGEGAEAEAPVEGESGLQAAKRRARERMDGGGV